MGRFWGIVIRIGVCNCGYARLWRGVSACNGGLMTLDWCRRVYGAVGFRREWGRLQ